MSNFAKLKDRARAFEQKSQWREALQAYTSMMEKWEGDEVDLGVWNRIGDLHLRLNEPEAAVAAYERAADAYSEMGLHNNAIALCNKVLRIAPERTSVHLKLGRVSAAKGFWADARQSFLIYAERMQRRGEIDASLDALTEFVDLFPDDDDTDVRRMLAEQLRAHGRAGEAIHQLRVLLGQLALRGREDEAPGVIELIRGIDPEADTTPLAAAQQSRAQGQAQGSGLGASGMELSAAPAPSPQARSAEESAPPTGIEPLPGLEATPIQEEPAGSVEDALIEIEPTSFGDFEGAFDEQLEAETGDEDAQPLPLLGMDAPTAWEEEEEGDGEADDDQAEPLPFLLETGPAEPAEPLPQLESLLEPEPADQSGPPEELESLVEPEPLAELEPLAEPEPLAELEPLPLLGAPAAEPEPAAAAEPPEPEDEESLRERLRELAAGGDYAAAIPVVRALRMLRPDDVLVGQKEVELAFKTGDPQLLVTAYEALAGQFEAVGEIAKARAVYQRILKIDPGHEAAAARAAPPPPAEPSRPAATEPPPGGYVDLGTLIMDDEPPEGTRFVVAEEEPSGDEERDFAEMLAVFRQKVNENIGSEDSSSHYDLGLAFKEMGLLDEAISQFQVALQGGAAPLPTLEVMAECFTEKKQWTVAQRVLERALGIPGAVEAEKIGIFYLLARCLEARGELGAAAEYYERVLALDIHFRDAPERAERVRQDVL